MTKRGLERLEVVTFRVAACGCSEVTTESTDTGVFWAALGGLRMLTRTEHGLELLEKLGLSVENLEWMATEARRELGSPPCRNALKIR